MKKLLTAFLLLALVIPIAFVATGCGNNAPDGPELGLGGMPNGRFGVHAVMVWSNAPADFFPNLPRGTVLTTEQIETLGCCDLNMDREIYVNDHMITFYNGEEVEEMAFSIAETGHIGFYPSGVVGEGERIQGGASRLHTHLRTNSDGSITLDIRFDQSNLLIFFQLSGAK